MSVPASKIYYLRLLFLTFLDSNALTLTLVTIDVRCRFYPFFEVIC